jgi:hypothetical protein
MCQRRFVAGCEKIVFALSEILHLADPIFTLKISRFLPSRPIQWLIELLDMFSTLSLAVQRPRYGQPFGDQKRTSEFQTTLFQGISLFSNYFSS